MSASASLNRNYAFMQVLKIVYRGDCNVFLNHD
jgi:hypothetical protein